MDDWPLVGYGRMSLVLSTEFNDHRHTGGQAVDALQLSYSEFGASYKKFQKTFC